MVPDAHGRIGLDPTNAMMICNDHMVLAKGRDYADISPIAGLILSSREQGVDAKVDVVPRAQFKESATFSGRAFKYYI